VQRSAVCCDEPNTKFASVDHWWSSDPATFRLVRGRISIAIAATLTLAACSTSGGDAVPIPGAQAAAAGPASAPAESDDDPDAFVPNTDDAAALTTATTEQSTTTSQPEAPSTTTTSSTSTTTTTTTTVPELDVFTPECVVEVESGDSLGLIVDAFDDETINISTVRSENDFEGEVLEPGQLLDICVDNGLNDVTGEERQRNEALVAAETIVAVKAQQEKLNELLTPFGMRELLVDGISGPVTRRHLCAARLAMWLPSELKDMSPGSDEERQLFATDSLAAPITSALESERWVLIDRTCQVMFLGRGATTLDHVFPTSTGSTGFETRDQNRSRIFRFNAATDNGGWHNSTLYPVPGDNPLNGNMYKPLYFDGGQAIHGANNVPTTPQSKGCARLSPSNQDTLLAWAGVDDRRSSSINNVYLTVNVQGSYPHGQSTDAVTPGNATVDL